MYYVVTSVNCKCVALCTHITSLVISVMWYIACATCLHYYQPAELCCLWTDGVEPVTWFIPLVTPANSCAGIYIQTKDVSSSTIADNRGFGNIAWSC